MKLKSILSIAFIWLFFFVGTGQIKSKSNLPYLKKEHLFFIDLGGLAYMRYDFGYEFRYNINHWSRFQTGIGVSYINFHFLEIISPRALPTVSFQFGKKWIWGEIGCQASMDIFRFTIKRSLFRNLAPFIGIHFKPARIFELGINYLPVFNIKNQLNPKVQLNEHRFQLRFRFIIMKKAKKAQFRHWNTKHALKDDIKEFFFIEDVLEE